MYKDRTDAQGWNTVCRDEVLEDHEDKSQERRGAQPRQVSWKLASFMETCTSEELLAVQ